MAHQVLFVPKRRQKTIQTIYFHFDEQGNIDTKQLDVPDVHAPWVQIQRKEYLRLCRAYGLQRRRHPTLTSDEQKEHRKQSYQQYRQRIQERRRQLGKPLASIAPGHSAVDSVINYVIQLLGKINPATGNPYTGIEIAIESGLSASSISRIKNGQRRSNHLQLD